MPWKKLDKVEFFAKKDMKKIILPLIIIALIGIILLFFYFEKEKEDSIEPQPIKPVSIRTGEAAHGWSLKDTSQEAVEEAVAMMKKKLKNKNPHYVLVWHTIAYDSQKIKETLREILGENVQIHGSSSAVGVISPDGYHIGKIGSLAILGIASEKIKIGVGGASLEELEPKEAGKKAIQEALINIGQKEKPQIIYITAAPGQEEEILSGIEEIIGPEAPVVGGSAGDETLKARWSNIANNRVYSNGVVLSAVFSDLKMGYGHEFGYLKSAKKGLVTRAEGRILYEINNRPAAEVYNEWTDGRFNKALNEGGMILAEATFYPLGKFLPEKEKEEKEYFPSHPGIINLPEKSITMFTNIKTGDELALLEGNWEWLINRVQKTGRKALVSGNISFNEGLFAFFTFCTGNLLGIPESERNKIAALLKDELGEIPYVGGFTLGEQIYFPRIGNRHANLVTSLIVFK